MTDRYPRRRGLALAAALLLQLAVLTGLVVYSLYPHWTGREVLLRTVPVDPRDLFRGNYASLRYEISRAPMPETGVPRVGRQVFVWLKQRDDGSWRARETRYSPPPGRYLRGRITAVRTGSVDVDYGIGAWFAPKDKALAMEKDLRDGALARLKVSDQGRAALVEVLPD